MRLTQLVLLYNTSNGFAGLSRQLHRRCSPAWRPLLGQLAGAPPSDVQHSCSPAPFWGRTATLWMATGW